MRHGFSASGNQTAISVTTEWQRFSVTMLGASGGGNVYFGILQFGAGNDVYEITQPQFEEGTTASDFVANTTGNPKFITGATYGPRVPMILVEPSATNLVTYSEDFSHSSWTKTAATMEGGHTAPDGTATAYKLIEDTSDSVHRTFQTATASVSPSASISVFVKYSGRRYVLIRFADQSVGRWYDLISGTLGDTYLSTPNDSSIELVGNDWYRITLSHTSNAQARCEFWVSDTESISSYTGDGTSGVYIWGAQLEAGSVATSLIPTSGGNAAARTRAADKLEITGTAFSNFFNTGGDGTFYVEFETKDAFRDFYILNGQNPQSRFFYSNYQNRLYSYDGAQSLVFGNVPSGLSRAAISYNSSNQFGSLNGSAMIGTTTHNGNLSNLTKLCIGSFYNNTDHLLGHIKRVLYWPVSNSNL
jgi:hypothetical protein